MNLLFTPQMVFILGGSLVVYWCILRRPSHRLFLLSTVSLSLLAYLHPYFALIALLIASIVQLTAGRLNSHTTLKFWWLWASVIAALLILLLGKYGGAIYVAIGMDVNWVERNLIVPLGISYLVFKLIHYVLDHYRGSLKNNSWLKLITYLFFFPILPAGPLETFQGLFSKRSQTFDPKLFSNGVRRTLIGYFKKLFVLELMCDSLFGGFITNFTSTASHSPLDPLAFVALMLLKAYIDLSAYTDIAIGISAMFGFRIMENFHHPFLKPNIAEFWRGWHISLSQWCRNNVYFPCFGATRKVWLATYASMLTMGLWHALSLNWATWGLYHATGLVLWANWNRYKKKHIQLKRIIASRLLKPVFVFGTFWFVAFGFSFVTTPSYSDGCRIFLSCLKSVAWIVTGGARWFT